MRFSLADFAPFRAVVIGVIASALIGVFSVGCKRPNAHTADSKLRQIDELLNQELPPGTAMARVTFLLNSRGYPQEDSHEAHTLVAVVEHVDTKTLEPSAARVTFHFDNNDKLLTYDLVSVTPAVH